MKRARRAPARPFPKLAGLMFDVDGTLLLSDRSLGGYELLPHAAETLEMLARRGMPYVLLTNGSAYPPAEQAEKLRKLGLAVRDEQMITPSSVAAQLMVARGVARVLVLGSEGVGHALREAGIETRTLAHAAPTEVDAVYVGWHPECGMKDIEAACNAILAGAKLYVASDVPFFATRAGRTIGYSYAIVGAIRRVTRAPMILTGKPSRHAMQFVARRLGVPVTRVGVVGDDPVVEMSMARRFGAAAFAVTTGVTSAAQWRSQPQARRPHRVLSDLRQVLDLLP
jgi:HAD superfamily hydrolase (TIGR01450 family)